MTSFAEAKSQFDAGPGMRRTLARSPLAVDGKTRTDLVIRNAQGEPLEEYYKWQFFHALVHSGFYPPDYLGAEIRFPKGNKGAAALKLDGAIFDDGEWIDRYNSFWKNGRSEDIEWLNAHLLGVIEFKRGDKEMARVFTGQVKPAMREKDPSTEYVLGIYYDKERLFLFHRRDGRCLRYDEAKNEKRDASGVAELSLHLPDPYSFLPSFEDLKQRVHRPTVLDRAQRSIDEMDVITSIATVQPQDALSHVLRTLDRVGLVNQRGYQIIIESFALKIFDEKRNKKASQKKLEFYITDDEEQFVALPDKSAQSFVKRMRGMHGEAESKYQKILGAKAIDWKDEAHVRAVAAVCKAFQDFSFVRSATTDLYQLVFYNFANAFTRSSAAQFLTPLPVIRFLVQIVNPRDGESVLDPCCGIGDFLSLSYVHSQRHTDPSQWLDDANVYGVDLDDNMIMLATLNMLLNGDGEAKLFRVPNHGSILTKIGAGDPPPAVQLLPDHHKGGAWDSWPDNTKLRKFDVILTNPPFGEDRAFRPSTPRDTKIVEMYETWSLAGSGDAIDLGVIFLENAYRCLKDEGRLGIVLSNSIASINKWREIREWFMSKMRIVALFDLPPNVFAETGVNTTLLVAYRPKPAQLAHLNTAGYSVFVRDIKNVGYEKRTSKRNVYFNPMYELDETTFDVATTTEDAPILDEDFSQTVLDFREWALGQEQTLQSLFGI